MNTNFFNTTPMTFVLFVLGFVVAAVMYYISLPCSERKKRKEIKALEKEIEDWAVQGDIYHDADDFSGFYHCLGEIAKLRTKINRLKSDGNDSNTRS